MEKRSFKPYGSISALTLGGGGLGQVWGETTREEAIATVNLALENGINHLDVAPMYGKGEAERVVGEVFKGKDLGDVKITTKCRLGTLPDDEVYERLISSLEKSLVNLNMERVDLFLLHSQLRQDDFQLYTLNEHRETNTTSLSCYYNAVIPAFERLKQEGKIGSWGIGGLGQNQAILEALNHEIQPEAIQCVVNPLNSAGAIGYVDQDFDPQKILTESQKVGIPILGIRAVQAGALTLKMDREPHPSGFDIRDFEDYDKAEPFRKLASEWKMNPSTLAHRYALSAEKVSSVILGVKNRSELLDCIKAESLGELNQDQISTIDTALSR
jgi:aryl-alcohol dehydrogenase-like predicted oxidoreductase|tara:strand:- start:309 stop:1292 length:984 start_codon:yes stop_codon:yes gene_type:complete